jgi:fructose-1,6-bisphosphatase I
MSPSHNIETELITLTRHVLHSQQMKKDATGDLTLLLLSIQLGCKFVSSSVRKAGLINLTGLSGQTNIQGEEVKKLDEVSNEIFINSLKSSGKVSIMVSEENENAIFVMGPLQGKYCVVFDPLDGSSNIDCGVSIGTIFGIYKIADGEPHDLKSVLKEGKHFVAAGYCMYGSTTVFMLSTGDGVNGYTLDTSIGEFILTHPNVKIPERGKIYSINEGNSKYWDKSTAEYINKLKEKPYSARYVGSMVSDVHRTVLYGGIFAYPSDSKSKSGKLRTLYECFPMAYIVEQAGGKASNGTKRILDILPTQIHGNNNNN